MELERPAPRHYRIALASDSEAFCKVVAPDRPRWQELARRFCVRVREFTGVEPERVTPEALPEADFTRYDLVLFGSILDNSAILKLYAEGQCFTDAAYPGIGGAEIRTVVDPLRAGRNVLLIGGSDLDTVREAAIQLYRSFPKVTTERDGVRLLHRLNFCVSPANMPWTPTEADIERIARRIDGEPTTRLDRAADFFLYAYQTDEAAWSALAERTLRPVLDDDPPTEGAWKLALAWALVQSFPAHWDDFRLALDRFLLRIGERLLTRWDEFRAGTPLTRDSASDALAVDRIGRHLDRVYGTNPFAAAIPAIERLFAVRDPGTRPDGDRDWLLVDQWLGWLLASERYDLLDDGFLAALTREALATTDNLAEPIGDPTTHRHVGNVLTKIAAYEDDGTPRWIARWIGGNRDDRIDPRREAAVAWNWYTGPYVPDRIAEEPHDLPRTEALAMPGDESTRLVVCRRDLDRSHEYLALQGAPNAVVPPGGIRRLTWSGESWLTDGAWLRSEAAARLLLRVDLPDLGILSLAVDGEGGTWTRTLVWRFDRSFLFVDEWHPDDPTRRVLRADWRSDATISREPGRWTLRSGIGTLHLVAEEGASLDRWEVDPSKPGSFRRATLVTPISTLSVTRCEGDGFAIGGTRCFLGATRIDDLEIDAAASLFDATTLSFARLRSVHAGGKERLVASAPIDLQLNRSTGDGFLRAEAKVVLRWVAEDGPGSITLEPGEYRTRFVDFDAAFFRLFP